ncbi:MAG: Lon protease family protein [Pontibacterium sp.]
MDQSCQLTSQALYRVCEHSQLTFETTQELETYKGFFGQHRALEAMEFGVGMIRPGYNLFVMGNPHTGRFSFAMESLRTSAQTADSPSDWVYLNNLDDRRYPKALPFPPGRADAFRKGVNSLLESILTELPAAFENPSYQRQKGKIEWEFNRQYEKAIEKVERQAREYSIAVYRDGGNVGFTPVKDGQAMDEAAFSQLTEEAREAFSNAIAELEELLNDALTELPTWRREATEELRELDQETAKATITPLLAPLKEAFSDVDGVAEYLEKLEQAMVKNLDELLGDERQSEAKSDAMRRAIVEESYGVNLLVNNIETQGAPVVHEAHPTYENLFGRVEYSAEMGAFSTNYQLIRSGALHRANGGYLVLEAEKLLEQPFVYAALKRALKSHEIRIENPASEYSGVSTITLNPEPIPLKVKVVLVGSRDIYYLLQDLDHDFEKMFRVVVDFDEDVKRTPRAINDYARLMATLAQEEGLGHLTRSAVARLVEHSSRLAQDQSLLSAHIGELVDLLCEANFHRVKAAGEFIDASHVNAALDAKQRRTSRLSEKIHESIVNETVLIDSDGSAVGKANGLTVLQVGDVSFGTTARITATVFPGTRGIVDIEREVALGQAIHSKGVMILSGYLGHQYAQDFAMALSANIALEQSYGYVDGDSASLAEICTLISALTHIPILQQYATTGSINQYGEVQAIGGVNEKVEGFFDLCQYRGLTGKQGVLIPKANVRNLMLKPEVVDAVEAGQFHVYAVATVDQALEILMGRKAGVRKSDGSFTQRSINHKVLMRLRELAKLKA